MGGEPRKKFVLKSFHTCEGKVTIVGSQKRDEARTLYLGKGN